MEFCPCGHRRWERHNWLAQCLDCDCGREDIDPDDALSILLFMIDENERAWLD